MTFVSPQWLWLLVLVPLYYGLVLFEQAKRSEKLEKFARQAVWAKLIPERDPVLGQRKGLLMGLLFALIIFALARPQWGYHEETVQIAGLDIMLVLDLSNSMETEDIVPTRLKKAKHLVKSLVDHLNGDRIGIVAFAGSAYVAVPLTTDLDYVLDTLEIQSPRMIQNQGTNIGMGLETALRSLERGAQEDSSGSQSHLASRVIILISDGEDFEDEAIQAAAKIKESGIRLYAFGVGTKKGGPVPVRDENGSTQGFKRDRSGQPVISSFQPEFLIKVASEAGGKYWDISASEGELNELIQDLGGLERSDFSERKFLIYEERFQIPLFLAFLVLILELSLPSRRRVQKAGLFILGFVFYFPQFSAQAATQLDSYVENQKGIEAFKAGRLEDAQRNFGAAQARDPSKPEPQFNQGVIYLQQGEMDKAIQSFAQAARFAQDQKDLSLFGKSLYNLGNTFAKKGDVSSAIPSYIGAIQSAQKVKDEKLEAEARKNLELLLEEEKKKQQQQQQQQNQNQDQKQQGQDQNKQDQKEKGQSEKDQAKNDQDKKEDKKSGKNQDGKDQNEKNQDEKEQQKQDQAKNSDKNQEGQEKQESPKSYRQGKKENFQSQKLTEEDAKRVAAEMANRDKALQEKLQNRHAKQKSNTKDW